MMTKDDLQTICDLTVKLTMLRQEKCNHLCIEDFAPEIFKKLLVAKNELDLGVIKRTDYEDGRFFVEFFKRFGPKFGEEK